MTQTDMRNLLDRLNQSQMVSEKFNPESDTFTEEQIKEIFEKALALRSKEKEPEPVSMTVKVNTLFKDAFEIVRRKVKSTGEVSKAERNVAQKGRELRNQKPALGKIINNVQRTAEDNPKAALLVSAVFDELYELDPENEQEFMATVKILNDVVNHDKTVAQALPSANLGNLKGIEPDQAPDLGDEVDMSIESGKHDNLYGDNEDPDMDLDELENELDWDRQNNYDDDDLSLEMGKYDNQTDEDDLELDLDDLEKEFNKENQKSATRRKRR